MNLFKSLRPPRARVPWHCPTSLLACVLGLPLLSHADTIAYRSGANTAPVSVEGTVMSVDNGELLFSTQSGSKTHRPLDNIVQLKIKNEPRFSAAEQAFVDQKWDEAAKEYARTIDSTDKDWIKTRATLRLVESAEKSQQFPLVNRAFVELAKSNVATAVKHRPASVPKDKPDQVTQAISDVDKALAGSIKTDQKELLTTYKATLLIAIGKQAEATKLLGGTPAAAPAAVAPPAAPSVTSAVGAAPAPSMAPPTAAPAAPAGGRAAVSADRALILADQAAQQKKWAEVVQTIESSRVSFTDPPQQAKALWYLAQAKEATAGNDPTRLQDSAIAYMRVVAHFDDDKTANAIVPDALLRAAGIEERLNHPDEASLIYEQLSKDQKYKGTAGATEATRKLAAMPKPKS